MPDTTPAAARPRRPSSGRVSTRRRHRALRAARVVLFAGIGAGVGLWVGARVTAPVGPFDATLWLRPSTTGETVVRLGPLGTITLDTHRAPVALEARVDDLRVDAAETIVTNPSVLGTLEEELAADTRTALRRLLLRAVVAAVVGGVVGGAAAALTWRSLVGGAGVGALVCTVVGGLAATSWRAEAVAEPEYTGLLGVAPRAVGDARVIVDRFGEYRAQLAELVGNVATLYQAASGLPTFTPGDDTVRVLHVSDLHLSPHAFDLIDALVESFSVDVVVDSGDITDWGTEPESAVVDGIGRLDVPYVWVRGNHDSRRTQAAVAAEPNAVVLDGEIAEVAGLRVFGIGDPRYTPDKSEEDGPEAEAAAAEAFAPEVADALREAGPPPDLVVVHDARIAAELGDLTPLVLAGHTHEPRQGAIGDAVLLVEGSTGGAGLRGLQGEEPEPLTCSVLYLDATTHELLAYDRVTVAGLGGSGARIERHLVVDEPVAAGDAGP